MRRIMVVGNLTHDAEVKDAANRKAINFAVAVNEVFKQQNGERQEKTTYYNCVVWRESNVNVASYLTKGTKVLLEGTPEVEVYKTKEGEVRGAIKIVVSNIQFLGKGSGATNNVSSSTPQGMMNVSGKDDDLPF